jgi:hypothetical protein
MGRIIARKGKNKNRDFGAAYEVLVHHYFSDDSVYDKADFEWRFRMPHSVYNHIHDSIVGDCLFKKKSDAAKKEGIFPLCRFVACLRILAQGAACDSEDEYLQLSETVLRDSLKNLCVQMVQKFEKENLNRCPTMEEKKCLLRINHADETSQGCLLLGTASILFGRIVQCVSQANTKPRWRQEDVNP